MSSISSKSTMTYILHFIQRRVNYCQTTLSVRISDLFLAVSSSVTVVIVILLVDPR